MAQGLTMVLKNTLWMAVYCERGLDQGCPWEADPVAWSPWVPHDPELDRPTWNRVLARTFRADDVGRDKALHLTVLSELLTAKLHVREVERLPT